MKLTYSLDTCSRIMNAQSTAVSLETVTHVVYDSRKIQTGNGALFFALSGLNRNGAQFIEQAYLKGVRWFVVAENTIHLPKLNDAIYLFVVDPLSALQQLANFHRQQFTYPVVAITGSVGKTTLKEWVNHVISPSLCVVRSPKSYNSQLGVALSLLELNSEAEVALIEAGISEPGEMERLETMIQPTLGVFTSLGSAHRHHFENEQQQLSEKLRLFIHASKTFVAESIGLSNTQLSEIHGESIAPIHLHHRWMTPGYEALVGLVKRLSIELGIPESVIETRLQTLPELALRMETFAGINENTIINDTYSLDLDALREALHYQQRMAGDRKRVVVIGLTEQTMALQSQLESILTDFGITNSFFVLPEESIPWEKITKSMVLVKGSRALQFEREVSRGRALKHRTLVEIDMSAIRHNVHYFRKKLLPETRILCMVKASSYGSGAERVATFLQQEGVDYFGVAFADEGVALRKTGITAPIMVMNADPEHAGAIIEYGLEPAIYSFDQLDTFITALIHAGITDYPVHLKFDTGMHRLGFLPTDKQRLLATVAAQPEIRVKGIYSHLADADNLTNPAFTIGQISLFTEIKEFFDTHIQYPILAHLLNSEGALHYPNAQFDMIRLGIVLYGFTSDSELQAELLPSIGWKSAVSQVKSVQAGEFIGYNCTFQAVSDMMIAVVPVGYADGFRRSLSNGKGAVYIHGNKCEVVGRVCMDMIMVNVTDFNVCENDEVEIIGKHQTMQDFARSMDTIPYEVMTGLSQRMHRVYLET